MSTTTNQELGPVIEQIVQQVFQTMLNMEVQARELPWPPGRELVTASISLSGSWKGAVFVECGFQDAFLFTSRMLEIDPPTELNDDVRDALGELANMVGGNLKSVLPGGVDLSLPSVVWGSDYTVGMCRAGTTERWVVESPETVFSVVVMTVTE